MVLATSGPYWGQNSASLDFKLCSDSLSPIHLLPVYHSHCYSCCYYLGLWDMCVRGWFSSWVCPLQECFLLAICDSLWIGVPLCTS